MFTDGDVELISYFIIQCRYIFINYIKFIFVSSLIRRFHALCGTFITAHILFLGSYKDPNKVNDTQA